MKREIDWVTIAIALGGLAWGTWYVLSTRLNPYDEPQAAWLITPILVAAWIAAPFVIRSAIGPLPERLRIDPRESLAHPARWRFVVGLPLLAAGVPLVGFVPVTVLYAPVLFWVLGERRAIVIVGGTAALVGIIQLGFAWGLGVDLPLWPAFANGRGHA